MIELPLRTRVLLYLYSTPHIVGCLAALAGVALYLAGVIDAGWWAIVLGLYLGAVLLTPGRTRLDQLNQAQAEEASLTESISHLIRLSINRVPMEAGKLLETIRQHVDVLMPKLKDLTDRGALESAVHLEIRQLLLRHLPDTLYSYLRIPAAYFKLHPDQDTVAGKQLVDQLRIIETSLALALKDAFKEDVTALAVQGRFLQDKYQAEPS